MLSLFKIVIISLATMCLCACGGSPTQEEPLKKVKEALITGDSFTAKSYFDKIDKHSNAWKNAQPFFERQILKKTREALASGDPSTAKEYLSMIDRDSEVWRNEGSILFDQILEKEITLRKAEKKKQKKEEGRSPEGGLISYNWHVDGFGAVAIIDRITIRNTSDEPCKDIKGIMSFYAKSKTLLGSKPFVIYDIVPPKSKKTFKDVNVGFVHSQVASSKIEILNCR